jgi:uncharacterized membrane protein
MTILVALAIGAPVVAIGSGRTALGTALLAVSVGGLAFGQPLVGWLSAKLDKDGASSAIDSSTYLRLIAISAGFWITLTGVFVFYMRSVSVGDDINAALLGGAYPLAWVVGWLAPFAPQGIGVFEATISAILASNELADLAVVIVGFRAILLVRDLAATGIAALIRGPSLSAK